MLPWHRVSLKGIHLFVCTWGRREKEDIAGEACVPWQTGRYLLYVSSPAPTRVNGGKVFSLSPVLFPVYTQRGNSCQGFALGSISLSGHKVSIFPAGPQTA